MTFEW